MAPNAIKPETLLRWQQDQFQHDRRNHSDIICLSRPDRLKHYGLHYAKYAGRIAVNCEQADVLRKTLSDTLLVFLSAANVLSQRLDKAYQPNPHDAFSRGMLEDLAVASGRFCDACEKIDHFEDFLALAKEANLAVLDWIVTTADLHDVDLEDLMVGRRKQLIERQFLIPGALDE